MKLISGAADGVLKLWSREGEFHLISSLKGHKGAITSLRWGGRGLIYSASQDATIRVWREATQELVANLDLHGGRVNHLSLSCDPLFYKPPPHLPSHTQSGNEDGQQRALRQYEAELQKTGEILVSASDDHCVTVWDLGKQLHPLRRLQGHTGPVIQICFSPDGNWIASASFDKTLRVWHAHSGMCWAVLRGHVLPVYCVCWSPDGKWISTASKDSTIKIWDFKKRKIHKNLPGHEDEVFALGWSFNGRTIVSGGRDCNIRIWQH